MMHTLIELPLEMPSSSTLDAPETQREMGMLGVMGQGFGEGQEADLHSGVADHDEGGQDTLPEAEGTIGVRDVGGHSQRARGRPDVCALHLRVPVALHPRRNHPAVQQRSPSLSLATNGHLVQPVLSDTAMKSSQLSKGLQLSVFTVALACRSPNGVGEQDIAGARKSRHQQ